MVEICASDNLTSVLCKPRCLQGIAEHLLEMSVSRDKFGVFKC